MFESVHFIDLVYSALCCFSAENVLCFVVKFITVLLQEGLQVIGKCGGLCGTCSPEEDVGLQVQLVEGNLCLISRLQSLKIYSLGTRSFNFLRAW